MFWAAGICLFTLGVVAVVSVCNNWSTVMGILYLGYWVNLLTTFVLAGAAVAWGFTFMDLHLSPRQNVKHSVLVFITLAVATAFYVAFFANEARTPATWTSLRQAMILMDALLLFVGYLTTMVHARLFTL
ncbi:hypothetical protein ACVNIS_24870 (plasmid) [Sphaerotilaceae bacterium SBD11-9]